MRLVSNRVKSSLSPSPPRASPAYSTHTHAPTSTSIAGYTISNCIGRGKFSTVYKGHKNRGKYEVVAIKCIRISTLSSRSKDNLMNEIYILSRINHQHVVSMKKFTHDAHYVYLILDYCPGGTLEEFIRSKGHLAEFLVQRFAQQLALGLQVLHAENIIHGDLKPANILLSIPPVGSCRNVKLKIADFGFSRKLENNQKYSSGILGSPLYMAPEILDMKPYSSQADLYSLGVILYECLFGEAPYATQDLNVLIREILSANPIQIPNKKDISDSCYDLLTRLLVKDQEKRMTFNELYRHSFIDIEHCPTQENYYKGVSLIRQATIFDNSGNYEDAKAFYVEGLLYLVPAYRWLDSFNDNQRKWLSRRVQEYCSRAEQITVNHLTAC